MRLPKRHRPTLEEQVAAAETEIRRVQWERPDDLRALNRARRRAQRARKRLAERRAA